MSEYLDIPLGQLKEPDVPVRTVGDEDKFLELCDSIALHGVIEPIVVRPDGDRYEIAVGHRRFLACRALGRPDIPAVVREMSDEEMFFARIEENMKREDVCPLDEGRYYRWMKEKSDLTNAQIAASIGRDPSYVSKRIGLLKMPPELQRSLEQKEINVGVAQELNRIPDEDARGYYLHYAKTDGATVQTVTRWRQDYDRSKEVMPQPMDVMDEIAQRRRAGKSAWMCRFCEAQGHAAYLISVWACDECLGLIEEAFATLKVREIPTDPP